MKPSCYDHYKEPKINKLSDVVKKVKKKKIVQTIPEKRMPKGLSLKPQGRFWKI